MSDYFATSNKDSTIGLFFKRYLYRQNLRVQNHNHVVDFNVGEKFLFGRVGRTFIPIEVKSKNYLKKISPKYLLAPHDNMQAMNFVVDVFNDFAKQFEKCAATGKIASKDPFLSNLKVYKAYIDPNARYDDYLSVYSDALKKQFKQRKINVLNFEHFMNSLLIVIRDGALSFPLTKPAYIKSHLCPINCSGFAIEIADLSYEDDEQKINKFVNSLNWDFYVNACNSYGFMIDLNVPWRIVADIDSEIMREYGKQYQVSTPDMVLSNQFNYVHFAYFNRFATDLLSIYNKVRKSSFTKAKICSNNEVHQEYVTPESYTVSTIKEKFTTSYFLKKYFQVRFLEEESRFNSAEQDRLIHECLEIYQALGVPYAATIFEQILNKTFDYKGSLSYINKQRQALAAEAENS